MASDVVRTPAAQYLRMSTEHQKYSIPYQTAAIAKYAEQNGFVVVRTYADPGRSGLRIHNRPGLSALLQDVVGREAAYKAVLVYDVSRWGRFQDLDEAAHYEFLCRHAGISVHYCAEQFTNDMAVTNTILKWLKRTMAAEYSRELSVKAFSGLQRAAAQGFRVGSTPGYGFRRMLVSPDGTSRQVLRDGERKGVRTDRIKLVLGPPEEVRAVRSIFQMLLHNRLGPTAIARELNRRSVPCLSKPWCLNNVKHILTNPKYCGVQVWGRTTKKLKTPVRRVPKERWITAPSRGATIISKQTFSRAQKAYLKRTGLKTNEQMLDDLRKLWAREGYLSTNLIATSRLTYAVNAYQRRFGTLSRAFQLIGYRQQRNKRQWEELRKSWRVCALLRRNLADRLQTMFPGRVTASDYGWCVHCPELNTDVVLSLCRATTVRGYPTWSVRWRRQQANSVTLLCLLNKNNDAFRAFYVFGRLQKGSKIYKNRELLSHGIKLRSLRDFYRAVTDADQRLSKAEKERPPKILIGSREIARYLNQPPDRILRLLRQDKPNAAQGRCVKVTPEQLKEWIQRNQAALTDWKPTRDRLGRFLPKLSLSQSAR